MHDNVRDRAFRRGTSGDALVGREDGIAAAGLRDSSELEAL
jgi:hypothetical protein